MVTHPMNIAELVKPETILLDLNVSTRNRLFEEIARKLEQQYGLNKDQIVKSLIAREELGSTALGLGMALPHARLKGLTEAKAVYVRTAWHCRLMPPMANRCHTFWPCWCQSVPPKRIYNCWPAWRNCSAIRISASICATARRRMRCTSCSSPAHRLKE